MDCAPITFGDDVKIGPKCGFYTSNHVEDPLGRQIGYCEAHPIKVSNNVVKGGLKVSVYGGLKTYDLGG